MVPVIIILSPAACNVAPQSTPGFDDVTKGLVVDGGGVDMHGTTRACTWTRLAVSAYAGDHHVRVQEACGWHAGDTLVVTSTIYRDLEEDQNEVLSIAAVSPDGHTLLLRDALRFNHYGEREYQAEVGWRNRNVRLVGWRNDSDADAFGGHTVVTGGGEGRFSGVEMVRMGQENVMGRYPFHFHLLDPPRSYADDIARWVSVGVRVGVAMGVRMSDCVTVCDCASMGERVCVTVCECARVTVCICG